MMARLARKPSPAERLAALRSTKQTFPMSVQDTSTIVEQLLEKHKVSRWIQLNELLGLPGLPDSISKTQAWLMSNGKSVKELVRYDHSISRETLVSGLPYETLIAYGERLRHAAEAAATAKQDRLERKAAAARQLSDFEAFLDVEAARATEPVHPDAPEPWALMAVLSKVALARIAGKGVRLTAEQTAILFAHLEERSAA